MKKQLTKKATTEAVTVDLEHCSASAQYAMRTECHADAVLIRAILGRWVTMWREDNSVFTREDGTSLWLPDLDVAFTLNPSAPSLNELRWLIDSLIDCHIAAQTLMPVSEYTGDRMDYDALDRVKVRPTDAVRQEARECARRTRACLRNSFQYMDAAAKKFDAELGNIEPHLASQAKLMASLCKTGLAPAASCRNDAEMVAMGRHLAEAVWAKRRP